MDGLGRITLRPGSTAWNASARSPGATATWDRETDMDSAPIKIEANLLGMMK